MLLCFFLRTFYRLSVLFNEQVLSHHLFLLCYYFVITFKTKLKFDFLTHFKNVPCTKIKIICSSVWTQRIVITTILFSYHNSDLVDTLRLNSAADTALFYIHGVRKVNWDISTYLNGLRYRYCIPNILKYILLFL